MATTNDAEVTSTKNDVSSQKKVKRVINSTKQAGKVVPANCDKLVATILNEERRKEQKMYLLALDNIRLRKRAFSTEKHSCLMCSIQCDSQDELFVHEKMAHWCQADNGYFCANDNGEWIKAPYICLSCGGGYPTSVRLQSHLYEVHNLRYEF